MTTYLLRVVLPDRPGMLGAVATAVGRAGGDILSLDVVERVAGAAVDDLVVELTGGRMADALLTAAHSVPGVEVESLRPYAGGADLHRDLELVEEFAAEPRRALELLVEHAPGVFRAGWALLAEPPSTTLHATPGAPAAEEALAPWLPLDRPRSVADEEEWVPARWRALGTELAAAPVPGAGAVLVGRPGGPAFRSSEVIRLSHLVGLAVGVATAAAAGGQPRA